VARKLTVIVLLCLLVVSVGVFPAHAKKKKKKPLPPAPIAHTLYLEGTTQMGEQEEFTVPLVRPGVWLQLTKTPGSGEKSHGIPSYSVGPNNDCSGNRYFPVFVGPLTGQVLGDIKVTFEAVSSPQGKAEIRIWRDQTEQLCNELYLEPVGKVIVDLPTSRGPVEAVIPNVDFDAEANWMIQITGIAGSPAGGPTVPPFYARAYYGLETSTVQFSCIPRSGTSCVPE
jgi:hypothetical protein